MSGLAGGRWVRLGLRAVRLLTGTAPRPFHASASVAASPPTEGFKPGKVAVVTKTTRYEFEQQRYLYAGLSEEDLKQLVRLPAPRCCPRAPRCCPR